MLNLLSRRLDYEEFFGEIRVVEAAKKVVIVVIVVMVVSRYMYVEKRIVQLLILTAQ